MDGTANAHPSMGIFSHQFFERDHSERHVANICEHSSFNDTNGCIVGGNGAGGIDLMLSLIPRSTHNLVHDSQNCIFDTRQTAARISRFRAIRFITAIGESALGLNVRMPSASNFTLRAMTSAASIWTDANDTFHHNGIFVLT